MESQGSAPTSKACFVPPWYARMLIPSRGWPYFMYQALLQEDAVSTMVAPSSSPALAVRWANAFSEIRRRRFDILREPSVARRLSNQLAREATNLGIDTVVAADSIIGAYLPRDFNLVLWLDATFDRLQQLYPEYARLSPRSLRNGHLMENSALERANLAIYSSEWARVSAFEVYGLSSVNSAVVPWGANLANVPAEDEMPALIEARTERKCTLLFVGLEWERKGGPLAVEIVRRIRDAGVDAELVVIGCRSGRERASDPFVRELGFLDKAKPQDLDRLESEFASARFLLLPTRADCTPSTIAEAGAFGVPSLVSGVGAIAELVEHDVGGYVFAPDATAEIYAHAVIDVVKDARTYRRLALGARSMFSSRLNWRASARRVSELLREVGE